MQTSNSTFDHVPYNYMFQLHEIVRETQHTRSTGKQWLSSSKPTNWAHTEHRAELKKNIYKQWRTSTIFVCAVGAFLLFFLLIVLAFVHAAVTYRTSLFDQLPSNVHINIIMYLKWSRAQVKCASDISSRTSSSEFRLFVRYDKRAQRLKTNNSEMNNAYLVSSWLNNNWR